ncbi:hypothetical protein SAMN02745221_02094 [Thermosyntropha lipolytica DSM 11003]|uniref:Hybrid cluster protein-associated redox disulfide domain-containing protein n=1 Tax=Thermosyntropha lipolytica DSM 11003 TaxID=1123382 RepID=A0A1M5RRW5_9FIRM|nr:hypothetical protein [Thermosyntropha lipolytica]SHH29004.1 hypothetical protein SAMN02745221_02094 [Thermosyntropha lipolytica DSM 11003]
MLNKEMLVVDVVEKFPCTEEVFKKYEEKAGNCIMCSHLFNTLEAVSRDYGLDLEQFMQDLEQSIKKGERVIF